MIKHAIKRLQNVFVLHKPLPLDDPPLSTPAAPCHCRMNSLPPPPHPVMFAAVSPQISQRLQLPSIVTLSQENLSTSKIQNWGVNGCSELLN
jgi:hypothetical protein